MNRTRETAQRIVAAMYDAGPPPGATPEVLRAWCCRQIDDGRGEGETAIAAGLTVAEVRRAVAERGR